MPEVANMLNQASWTGAGRSAKSGRRTGRLYAFRSMSKSIACSSMSRARASFVSPITLWTRSRGSS